MKFLLALMILLPGCSKPVSVSQLIIATHTQSGYRIGCLSSLLYIKRHLANPLAKYQDELLEFCKTSKYYEDTGSI